MKFTNVANVAGFPSWLGCNSPSLGYLAQLVINSMDYSSIQVKLYKEKTLMLRLCTISLSPDRHHANRFVGHKRDCIRVQSA